MKIPVVAVYTLVSLDSQTLGSLKFLSCQLYKKSQLCVLLLQEVTTSF